MKDHIKKAINIYKNQGGAVLIRKGRRFIRYNLMRFPINISFRDMTKNLREEYEFVSNPIFQITSKDIEESNKVRSSKLPSKIVKANWFVPNFNHIKYGGIYTIFRFIEKFSVEGVKNRVIIYDCPSFNVSSLKKQIKENFGNLLDYEIIIFDIRSDDLDKLPEADISFCTFWTSAYLLLKFNKTKRKYYFIQDYEPLFYPGGSTYALAESTYRFGFRGLVNTPGLLAAVNSRHGMEGISFIPAVDRTTYYPAKNKMNDKTRIFFYARPNNPRNAFNLGIVIIKALKKKYGDKIEIVTAGASWNEDSYGLKGKVVNYGLLNNIEDVAELYRSCDIGFVYMLSKHPSYQPFEFMASGMATVTNNNEDNLWLLDNGVNCLLSEPSPADMCDKLSKLIDDKKLREKIINGGIKTSTYTWEQQTDAIWNDIKHY